MHGLDPPGMHIYRTVLMHRPYWFGVKKILVRFFSNHGW